MGGSVPAIPGLKVDRDLVHALRQDVARLLGREKPNFPGAQPVSFAARHILELQKQDYYVCEKSDGIRCLLFLTNDGADELTYLIDRKNDYYYVKGLHFPLPDSEQLFHTGTLVDGELVNDRQPNGEMQMKYLVFDCMMLDNSSLMHRTLDKRLAYFKDKVYNPYQTLYTKYPEEIQYLPFIVEFKKMEFSYGIEMMFRDILPYLPHGNDGLIFTCRNSPYKFGTDENILKWKVANENSIDFRLMLDWPMIEPDEDEEREGTTSPYPDYDATPIFNLSAFMGEGQYSWYGTMYVEPAEWESLKSLGQPLDDRIVECYQDDRNRWRFLRFRDDKHEANHISTVASVIESIQDRISQDDLIRNAKRIRDEWKKRAAAEEAMLKQQAATRKSSIAPPAALNGGQLNSGLKRKLDENGALVDANDTAKRKLTPQRMTPPRLTPQPEL